MIHVQHLDNTWVFWRHTPLSTLRISWNKPKKVQIIQQLEDGKSCLVRSKGRSITTTSDTCPRGFVSAMQHPCKHIFAVRMSLSLPEYESLFVERWRFSKQPSRIRAKGLNWWWYGWYQYLNAHLWTCICCTIRATEIQKGVQSSSKTYVSNSLLLVCVISLTD